MDSSDDPLTNVLPPDDSDVDDALYQVLHPVLVGASTYLATLAAQSQNAADSTALGLISQRLAEVTIHLEDWLRQKRHWASVIGWLSLAGCTLEEWSVEMIEPLAEAAWFLA